MPTKLFILFAILILPLAPGCGGGSGPAAPGGAAPDRGDPSLIAPRVLMAGGFVTAIGSAPLGDVYALQEGGQLFRRVSGQWEPVFYPAEQDFRWNFDSMWVSPTGTIHLTSTHSYVRYDGTDWEVFRTGYSGRSDALAGLSDDRVFVLRGGDLFRFDLDTGEWVVEDVPTGGGRLRAIHSIGTRIFAVGNDGVLLESSGSSWGARDTGTTTNLYAVYAAAAGDVFVAGENGYFALIGFSSISNVEFSTSLTDPIRCLAGTGSSSVYIGTKQVHHFDGVSVSRVGSVESTTAMRTIWAGAGNDLLVADYFGGIFSHFTGSNWSDAFESPLSYLGSFYADGQGKILLGGYGLLHFEQGRWVLDRESDSLFRTMYGLEADDVWTSNTAGEIYHWDGGVWTFTAQPGDEEMKAFWGAASDDVYAVGQSGAAMHWDGGGWAELDTPTTASLTQLAGNAEALFALGSGSTLLQFVDGRWFDQALPLTSPTGAQLGNLGSTVFLKSRQEFLVYENGAWAPMGLPDELLEGAVHGTALDDIFRMGPRGVLHFDGATVRSMPAVRDRTLGGRGSFSPREFWTWGINLTRYGIGEISR